MLTYHLATIPMFLGTHIKLTFINKLTVGQKVKGRIILHICVQNREYQG